MSQSKSLTTALEAVERIFAAETSDLKELALIAGANPYRVFDGADLAGLDLRQTDIDFLLGQEVEFEGARLTDGQRRAFRAARRRRKSQSIGQGQQAERLRVVREFVFFYSSKPDLLPSAKDVGKLSIALVEKTLLLPIEEYNHRSASLNTEFTNGVLETFGAWCSHAHFAISPNFIVQIFALLGSLKSPVDGATIEILKDPWRSELGEILGRCIAAFGQNDALDNYWLNRSTLAETYAAASQIGAFRSVSGGAAEDALTSVAARPSDTSWKELLEFLAQIPFACDNDRAERLALLLTRLDWSADHTLEILQAPTPRKIRNALFRQMLAQGRSDRVLEVLRWLNDNRGAVGALSLENALLQISEFDPVLRLAVELEPDLSDFQLSIFALALRERAGNQYQRTQAQRFAKYLTSSVPNRPFK